MNDVRKYIVSTTLREPLGWNNSKLIGGNVAEEIAELKRQPGGDISISGSGTLVRSLLKDGLIDELRLMVHPVVVGSGKRLFGDGLNQLPWSLWSPKPSPRASSTSPTGRQAVRTTTGRRSPHEHEGGHREATDLAPHPFKRRRRSQVTPG